MLRTLQDEALNTLLISSRWTGRGAHPLDAHRQLTVVVEAIQPVKDALTPEEFRDWLRMMSSRGFRGEEDTYTILRYNAFCEVLELYYEYIEDAGDDVDTDYLLDRSDELMFHFYRWTEHHHFDVWTHEFPISWLRERSAMERSRFPNYWMLSCFKKGYTDKHLLELGVMTCYSFSLDEMTQMIELLESQTPPVPLSAITDLHGLKRYTTSLQLTAAFNAGLFTEEAVRRAGRRAGVTPRNKNFWEATVQSVYSD